MMQQPLGDFAPPLHEELSQFHTPPKLAAKMVRWVGVSSCRVLEPSAGGGNIVREIEAAGARYIRAIEIDPAWCNVLSEQAALSRLCPVCVLNGDFLKLQPEDFDVVIMNPPLNDGVAGKHITRALEWAPRVVSIVRGGDLYGVNRYDELWSKHTLVAEAKLVRRPPFGGDWHVGKTEFSVVCVERGRNGPMLQKIEFWPEVWS